MEPIDKFAQMTLERRLDKQLTKTINLLAWMERVATGKERMVLKDLPHPE